MFKEKEYLTTKEGLERLKQKLMWRKNVEAKRLGNIMGEMAEDGDHRENDGYLVAVEMYTVNLEEALKLIKRIQNAKIILKSTNGEASLGSKVIVKDKTGEEKEYEIVSQAEANPGKQKISHESPLGKALLGRTEREEIVFTTPLGQINLQLITIS